jgi:hypothetical protein
LDKRTHNDASLPEPVSLTLEEAMQVTGGSGTLLTSVAQLVKKFDHPVLVNGLDPDGWAVLAKGYQAGF